MSSCEEPPPAPPWVQLRPGPTETTLPPGLCKQPRGHDSSGGAWPGERRDGSTDPLPGCRAIGTPPSCRLERVGVGWGQEKRPRALQLQERVRPFTPKQAGGCRVLEGTCMSRDVGVGVSVGRRVLCPGMQTQGEGGGSNAPPPGQKEPAGSSTERPSLAHPQCLWAVRRDLQPPGERTQPPSQTCLSPTSWHPRNSTGPSAEHSPVQGQLPAPSASPSGLALRLAPACPLPTAQAATPWIPPSAAEYPPPPPPPPPPLPLRNFARMGHSSSSLGERPKPRVWGSWVLHALSCQWLLKFLVSGESPTLFLPSAPHPHPVPCPGLGSGVS